MLGKDSKADSTLILAVALLLVMGVVLVYSASSFKAQESFGDGHYFLKNHLYRVILGILLMVIASQVNYRVWLNISPFVLGICCLILVYMLFADSVTAVRGSRRWLTVGFLTFQPSDFARAALILFLSLSLGASKRIAAKSLQSFLFHLGIISCVVLPIALQPDIGSALLTAFLALVLLFVAGERLRHLVMLAMTTAPLVLLYILREGYQRVRVMKYLSALRGDGLEWQAKQAFIALGHGGLFGVGLGGSRQKLHFLPDPFTDFIFGIVGEELGLIGTTAVIVLFMILIWSGFRIVRQCDELAGKILAIGLVLNIGIYAAANMAVVVSLLPTTGIPMPFLSYGGSALLVNLFGVGVLLNIADQSHRAHELRPVGRYAHRRKPGR